jgi:nuclease-like protein
MKRISLLFVSAALTVAMSLTAFAGQWKSDNRGYWYQKDDNSYPILSWQEIGGKWYYFGSDGYMAASQWVGNYYVGSDGAMLTNTTTPDGYKVGADGTWIQNSSSSTAANNDNNNSTDGLIPAISRTPFEGYTVVVNTSTKKYHVPGCRDVKKIADRNLGYSKDIAALEAAGYQPCKVCH